MIFTILWTLALARLPSYQRCLTALANYEGYKGGDTLTVTFPPGYSDDEIKQTVEQLGPLVREVRYHSDRVREHEEREKKIAEWRTSTRALREENEKACEVLQQEIEAANAKRWYWNREPKMSRSYSWFDDEEGRKTWTPCQRAHYYDNKLYEQQMAAGHHPLICVGECGTTVHLKVY